ncbi:TetR family transcriptional regulator [Microlunatus endophyticus]|uniref:TetR family transcriptional regulator n=1 Tax=Microlunatus endophyticus TaxID=1716077 RepID=A0A917SCT2_9ACTN|nr:TetR family transcriptional regulator [Microlunatus endophyticus]
MSSVTEKKAERIPAAERREQILQAAARVFGARGYAGATTDVVAQEAGISQPYVVRMFGGKDNLLVAVLERARNQVLTTFRQVLEDAGSQAGAEELAPRLALAYVDLIEDDTIQMALMQGFLLGHHPVIGPCARRGFTDIYRLLRDEADFGPDMARDFLAQGMLINTVLALRIPAEHDVDPTARELVQECFGKKAGLVLRATAAQQARQIGTPAD